MKKVATIDCGCEKCGNKNPKRIRISLDYKNKKVMARGHAGENEVEMYYAHKDLPRAKWAEKCLNDLETMYRDYSTWHLEMI